LNTLYLGELNLIKSSLYRANRAALTILQCDKIIETIKIETDLLNRLCEVIVYSCGYRLCWIGFIDGSKEKLVRATASVGFDDGYLDKVKITWDESPTGQGPTGMAIKTKEPVIAQDIINNKKFEPWQEEALKRGYGSSIALPLFTDNTIYGTINIYAPESNAFDDEEIKLLKTVSENISNGITQLRE